MDWLCHFCLVLNCNVCIGAGNQTISVFCLPCEDCLFILYNQSLVCSSSHAWISENTVFSVLVHSRFEGLLSTYILLRASVAWSLFLMKWVNFIFLAKNYFFWPKIIFFVILRNNLGTSRESMSGPLASNQVRYRWTKCMSLSLFSQ